MTACQLIIKEGFLFDILFFLIRNLDKTQMLKNGF